MNKEMMGAVVVLGCIAFLAWFLWCIFRWIDDLISRREPQPLPDLEAAKKLLETPRQVTGTNEWVRTKCETEVCAAPMAANNLDVHDRNAPGHDPKKCKHCNVKPGHSGISYRSAN